MNRSKKLYILLGVLTAACIATFAVLRMEERKEQIRETGEIILELPGESVQSLSWEYNEETLAFHRDETWLYDEDENCPVSEEKIHALLEQFQAFGAAFIIEDVEDFGQYGLDDPICTIRLSTAEQTYEVRLGSYSQMDSRRYVSIGDGNVYLVKHDPLDEYDAELSDMIDHDEMPSFDHVRQIQFEGAEAYSITCREDSADSCNAEDIYFTQRSGKTLPLDTSRVDSYLQSITNLNPVDYVSYNVTDAELQTYGLDAPEWTVTVDYTTEGDEGEETADTFILYVSPDPEAVKAAEKAEDGEETEIPAYVRAGDSQIVYKVSTGSYKKLVAASCNDFRHTEVMWADFSDVRKIDISLEGSTYTFASEQDGEDRTWSYGDKKEVEITDLQSALETMTAEEFTDEPPAQKEEISLTIYLDNGNFPRVEIQLYRYDGSRCLAVVDGESVSLVKRTAVVDLIEAVHAIVLDSIEKAGPAQGADPAILIIAMDCARANLDLVKSGEVYGLVAQPLIEERAAFAPEFGGKMVSLYDEETGTELLEHSPGPDYLRPVYDGEYIRAECSGADDMFPTIDPCCYDEGPWRGVWIPDHGEAWALSWNCEVLPQQMHLWTSSPRYSAGVRQQTVAHGFYDNSPAAVWDIPECLLRSGEGVLPAGREMRELHAAARLRTWYVDTMDLPKRPLDSVIKEVYHKSDSVPLRRTSCPKRRSAFGKKKGERT